MHANVLADNELHARKTDPCLRLHGDPERHFRRAEIDHDRGSRRLELADRRSRHVERKRALIDVANVAFGARDRDRHPGLEFLGGMRRADDRGDAEFARHDGGMTGPAALVGDDAGGDLHHRLPIRTGGRRDQNLPWPEGREVARRGDAAHVSAGDLVRPPRGR